MSPSTLEAAAERWVPGGGAVSVQALTSGLVNRSCRVEREGRVYSLRLASPEVDDLGLDREWECRVLRVASAAGLAPRLSECRPQQGIVVAEWVSGRAWTPAEIARSGMVEAMAELLRQVHSLSVPEPHRVMNAGSWIAHYSAAAARHESGRPPDALRLRGAAEQHLRELAALGPARPVLCHSDVHRFNVVSDGSTGRPVLLDWEYAHVSDGAWDLAGWAANNDWSAEQARLLLSAYLQRAPAAVEVRRLELLVWLYDYVCLLWSALHAHRCAGTDIAAVAARAVLLGARLAAGSGSRAG